MGWDTTSVRPEDRCSGTVRRAAFAFLLFLAFFLLAAALYHRALDAEVYYDTKGRIQEQAPVFNRGRLVDVIHIFPQRPLTMATFYVNYLVGGMNPRWLRLVNIAILAATGVVVTILIQIILGISESRGHVGGGDRTIVSVAAGLFFVIHPIVTWGTLYIWQRAALLACFFYFCCLAVYLAVRAGKLPYRRTGYVLCVLLFEAALFSKENSITLPIAVLFAEISFFASGWKKIVKRGTVLVLLSLVSIIVLSLVEAPHGSPALGHGILGTVARYYREAGVTFGQVLLTQCRMFFYYLSLIVVPFPSRVQLMAPQTISSSLFEPSSTVWAVAGLAVLFSTTVYLLRKWPCWAFGILLFSVGLVPEAVLVPQYAFLGYRAILPMVGVLIVAADLGLRVLRALDRGEMKGRALRAFLVVAGGVYLGFIGAESFGEAEIWRNPISFWGEIVSRFPANEIRLERSTRVQALYNLGYSLLKKRRLEEALSCFTQACRIAPKSAESHNAAGYVLLRLGRFREAKEHFETTLKLSPGHVDARQNLARALKKLKDSKTERGLPSRDRGPW